MLMCDVNVLVYAHREDSPNHSRYRQWLEDQVNSDASFAVSELVLSGFLRIVTHPKIFDPPSALEDALEFVGAIRSQANCVVVSPQARHWDIFLKLCQVANAKGNLIPDAYHAALAIEAGCEWITTDRGFSRYPGLRWRTP
ncbi:MAG: type II toxin-antitoxin system VapC family toxin [Pseudomonadota bacterium]|nr:type II toxin-antitoxin system VapC family toxin [Pseudomonadota bacterium]MDP1903090.1 type II toxin-antitoxin system VapC family toxin [Pseudomonadota bacterium]MDP2353080.1 type II toxin-antitoxin system VapC family toxin [Pseudomonadota bacterium]